MDAEDFCMTWQTTGFGLRRNLPEVRVTSGQKPSTKIITLPKETLLVGYKNIYIVLQTSVGLF